jgi:hypothetical protein
MRQLSGRRFCLECSALDGYNRRTYIIDIDEGQAFCARCQQQKPRNEFYSRKSGKPLSYCKSCQDKIKNLKFEEKIEKAIALKSGTCADCGQTFPAPVFEFLYKEQVLPISMVKNMSWERFLKVLERCEMLCRNCGALREWARSS